MKQIKELQQIQYELVVIGNTNVGKSTFLNTLTKMKSYFNTSVNRETSCVWTFKVDPASEASPYSIKKICADPQSSEAGANPSMRMFSQDLTEEANKYNEEQ